MEAKSEVEITERSSFADAIAKRIGARFQNLLWPLTANRFCKITQRSASQPRLVTELAHQIRTMELNPTDFILVQFAVPTRHRFAANFLKTHFRRGIYCPGTDS